MTLQPSDNKRLFALHLRRDIEPRDPPAVMPETEVDGLSVGPCHPAIGQGGRIQGQEPGEQYGGGSSQHPPSLVRDTGKSG